MKKTDRWIPATGFHQRSAGRRARVPGDRGRAGPLVPQRYLTIWLKASSVLRACLIPPNASTISLACTNCSMETFVSAVLSLAGRPRLAGAARFVAALGRPGL